MAMMTQAATAAPAMALAGTTPLPLSGALGAAAAAVFPLFTPSAPATAPLGVGDEDCDTLSVGLSRGEEVGPPDAGVLGVGVGATPDPDRVAAAVGDVVPEVPLLSEEGDGTTDTVGVSVLLGFAVGLGETATIEAVWF